MSLCIINEVKKAKKDPEIGVLGYNFGLSDGLLPNLGRNGS